jgi:NTP pyrophosphatase (non-canonical NTP hydrolase)
MNALNKYRDEAFAYAEKQGFHQSPTNFGERLMLIVSELSEALEADRLGSWCVAAPSTVKPEDYGLVIKGTVEEKLSDALIRIFDLAGIYDIDMDSHVAAKMAYNRTRPYKHGKHYG